MTKDELIERLKGHEWNDIEFKQAQWEVPNDAYSTVSAFSNTEGGWLIFGVSDNHGKFEIVGVLEVDKVQNNFLSALRDGQKFNRVISANAEMINHEEGTLLVFYIPEVRRNEKPIYLKGDIKQTYIRRGSGDEKCTLSEIERFLRDASADRYDNDIIDGLDPDNCFDEESLKWYRRIFDQKNPGRSEPLSDIEFLREWGFIVESDNKPVPKRSAILVFGSGRSLRSIFPRPVVDYQWISSNFDDWSPDKRWDDRLVIEENLIQAWRMLVDKYMTHVERPFSLDLANLRRSDDPPDYISFREAAINLLIHQDFGDHTRTPVIKFFRDKTVFYNPGDAFATKEELLEPTEKEVRNPSIVAAFRRIGLSDQAGTGIRSIFINWQRLGNIPPEINNKKNEKSFEIILHKEELLSEEQLLLQTSLGVHLTDNEAKAFAYACRKGTLNITDVKAVTGLNAPKAIEVLNRLVVQVLLKPVEEGNSNLYQLADHLKTQHPCGEETDQVEQDKDRLVTDQPSPKEERLVTDQVPILTTITDTQWKIIQLCEVPRLLVDITDELGFANRSFFRKNHLDPLIHVRIIRNTHPENPNHPDQRYLLTENGLKLKLKHFGTPESNDGEEAK